MKKKILNFIKFLLFLGVGVVILYLVYNSQSAAYEASCAERGIPAEDCSLIRKVLNDFASANYFWIFLTLVAFTFSNLSRAIRWNMLLRPLGYKPRLSNAFLTVILGYFANLGFPRIGEVVRAGSMARYEHIPVEKVMGTIVVDRTIDVISILLITSLAILLEFDTMWQFINEYVSLSEKFGGSGPFLLTLAGIGLFFVALIYFLRKRIAQWSWYQKIENILLGFWEGIKSIRNLERPWVFVLHSINIWFMYFLMTYLCFFAYQPTAHLSPLVGLVVFVFGGWGIVIPSPGGMGTYHFLVQTALGMYGISGEDSFSFANIAFFSIQLGCNVLIGLLALLLLPWLNRDYAGAEKVAVAQETFLLFFPQKSNIFTRRKTLKPSP